VCVLDDALSGGLRASQIYLIAEKKNKYYVINTLEEQDRPETNTEKLSRLIRETNQLTQELDNNQKVKILNHMKINM
jgi:hypothetical protein